MARALLTGLIAGIALTLPLSAQSFELKPRKIKLSNANAEVFPELELRAQSFFSSPVTEPRYKTKDPQKFATYFGPDDALQVVFAGDERKGWGKGFDYLFADLEGEGNLAKSKKLSGKPILVSTNTEDTSFPAFKFKIPTGEEETEYNVQARLAVSRTSPSDKTPRDSTLYLTSLCCLEGDVEFDGQKRKMIVFDANCNGVFGERGAPTRSSDSAGGDKLWVGSGSPKLEEAYVEALPLGMYTLVDGKYYDVEVAPDNSVEIALSEVELGQIEVASPGFLLELARGNEVLYITNPEGNELDVPVGSYELITPGFRMNGKGGIWELQGDPIAERQNFTVDAGEKTTIEVGPPLKLVVTTASKGSGTGLEISLKFHIEGSAGETYKYLRQNGKKVRLPEISVQTDRGKEVKKGRFEYG